MKLHFIGEYVLHRALNSNTAKFYV